MARDAIAPHLVAWIESSRPYHPRWYDLLDPDHPAYNPDYLPLAEALARGEVTSSPSTRLPAPPAQFANFLRSIARHARDRLRKATPDVRQSRLAICGGCDRNARGRCLECGCYLERKASWASSSCPLGKWAAAGQGAGCGCGS